MNYEFRVREIPEQHLLAVHDQAKGDLPQKIVGNLDKVWTYLRANDIKPGHNVVVYRNYDRASGVMTIDVGVQVDAGPPGDGTVVPTTTPGGLIATTTHI